MISTQYKWKNNVYISGLINMKNKYYYRKLLNITLRGKTHIKPNEPAVKPTAQKNKNSKKSLLPIGI